MSDLPRLGVAFSGGLNASELLDCVSLSESLGYESAWVAEGHGGDQFAVLSAAARETSTILLGTAISSVYVRSVPTIAMAAATVDELSAGRFILGLGSSHKVQVEPEHGVVYDKPLTRLRETVSVIRSLLRDGEVQYAGELVRIESFDLWFTPRRPDIPIYLAAVFPKMTLACGEIADGIILTRSSLKTAGEVKSLIERGAASRGRDPAAVTISSLLPTAVAESRAQARDLLRPGLAFYAGFFPRYNRLLGGHGFEAEAKAVASAWKRGDKNAATAAVSDAMIDASSIAGRPEECREQLQAYRDSGIELPIITPHAHGPGAKETFLAAIRACIAN